VLLLGQDPNIHPHPSVHVTAVPVSQISIHELVPKNKNKSNMINTLILNSVEFNLIFTIPKDYFPLNYRKKKI
jgi:hypothetical protein